MSLKDQYNFEFLTNEAERLVLDELKRRFDEDKEEKICKCEDCVLDMAAYALNHVRPAYRASLLGTLYAHALEGSEYQADVKKAVDQAIEIVSKNPSHE
ncbi:MAG: competence protein ComFB [Spirochaetes bacterium]|nr:MAG: competence protein ComFB [Spirochaetota bacterium]